MPHTLERGFLTTGPPGKSPGLFLYFDLFIFDHTTAYGISTVLESCSHYPWPLGESKQLYSDGINPVVFLVWATINPPNSTIKQQLGGLWSGPTPFHCPKALL